jgi:hypothetical protein
MIRLTLNTQSDPEIHVFNKSVILIGAESTLVDLVLPAGLNIQPIHLKIIEQDDSFILVNYVNDPFVSVNDHSFGKKLLKSGDVITIHRINLVFEIFPTESQKVKEENLCSLLESKMKKQETAQPRVLAPSIKGNSIDSSFSLPFEQEVSALGEEEFKKSSLDKYLKDFESIYPSLPESLEEKQQIERKKTASLKDDYLRDLDDDNQKNDNQAAFIHPKETSHLYQAWKWILLFIFSLLAISGIVGTIIYFSVSDKTEAQESKAAQGVADVAMALIHAQLNHLKPHNHNWSDVDFLKSSLQSVLPDTSSYASQIDAQGQFNCCPYSLRIYTNSDLSHFLLIAQPAPNLLNWLIPQSLIVVDSHLMELRMLKDVRNLNRLLANPDPLEGLNGKEITTLIKQGGLIRLVTLASETGHIDFAPPKNLAWIRPGSENLIYNAPRYYRLGHNVVQKAMALSTSKGSSQEVTALKQEVEALSWLSHFTLYSDQGKKSAMLVRQGLTLFAPSDKLLFGYLLFNAQGKIQQVHLLKDEEEWKDAPIINTIKESELVAFNAPSDMVKEEANKKNAEIPDIDINHPVYIQLQSLVSARENELTPLNTDLTNLMNQELQAPHPHFQVEFQNLSHTYLMADAKHKQAIKEALETLYQQYEDIPIHQFLAFVKTLNLEQLIQQEDSSLALVDENCQQNMNLLLTYIENSQSLTELDNLIHIANTWLTFDYIKDSHELIKYQNLLRNQLLEQLEKYLLSQKKHFLIKSDDKEVLQHILNHERLIKPEEKDFFLEEFDEIVARHQSEGETVNEE